MQKELKQNPQSNVNTLSTHCGIHTKDRKSVLMKILICFITRIIEILVWPIEMSSLAKKSVLLLGRLCGMVDNFLDSYIVVS